MAISNDIVQIFAAIQDEETMRRFLGEILTQSERETIQLRWDLMKRLNEGESQRHIAAELGISLCKITRGSKILKNRDSVSSRILRSGSNQIK